MYLILGSLIRSKSVEKNFFNVVSVYFLFFLFFRTVILQAHSSVLYCLYKIDNTSAVDGS